MAKKKKDEGPGKGLIITLVFFILTTIALGVMTYLGFDGQLEYEKKAADADAKAKTAVASAEEERVRRNVLRTGLGIQDPNDATDLSGMARTHGAAMLDEHKRLTDKLAGAFPNRNDFSWPLMTAAATGAQSFSDISPQPAKSIPAIVKDWATLYANLMAAKRSVDLEKEAAETAKQAAQAAQKQQKEIFDQSIADLKKRVDDEIANNQKKFLALKTEADKKAADFAAKAVEFATDKGRYEEELNKFQKDLTALLETSQSKTYGELKRKLADLTKEGSDALFRFNNLDLARLDESKGSISTKDDNFVTLTFNRSINLLPGQTFVVIPPTGSLADVIDLEKTLQKNYEDRFGKYPPREPFANNDKIKGMVEVTTVLDKYSARAKITSQLLPVRNPVSRGDQLFNIALSTSDRDHVAFAGVIDLNGDGEPDTEEFIRILERNGVVVDAYLDLKTGIVRGPGMSVKTKFLILGTDAPEAGQIGKLRDKARELGIQLVESRKFLSLIGQSLPKNPLSPNYGGSVNTGTDVAAPPAPPADKKDEAVPPK
jgi:flagellar basal body-associated protein FliL